MNEARRTIWTAGIGLLVVLAFANGVRAVKIGDITHLQGTRINKLNGMGLVMGLKGTGDGGKYLPTMNSLAELYQHFGVRVTLLDDLKMAKNVAIVEIEATLPENGVREGDRIDVQVSSVGAAKSLEGGRLLLTPLVGPDPEDTRVIAMASGPLQIVRPDVLTVARIVQGATLERDWIHNYIALGRELSLYRNRSGGQPMTWLRPDEPYVTLVLDGPHAEWAVAHTIAQYINEDAAVSEVTAGNVGAQIAVAVDPRTVVVRVPEAERANPAPFLGRIENLQLFMPPTEARVTINHANGAIVISGDAEISPAVVSYKGLTITTVVPEQAPTPENPRTVQQDWVKIDPQKKGGAKLSDLVDALNLLRVPPPDRIAIIEQLHKTGKLHATVQVER